MIGIHENGELRTLGTGYTLGTSGGGGTAVPTADTNAKFDSDAHMNSTDMTTESGGEVEEFIDELNITGGLLGDYVVEQGTSGQWIYRKWNSGTLEQWYDGATGAYTVGTARGSLYSGGYINYIYPIPFIETPSVVTGATLSTDAYVVWTQERDYTTASISVRIVASASITQNSNYAIHIHAVGRWK